MITSRADVGGGPKYTLDLLKSLSKIMDVYSASPMDKPFYELYKKYSKNIYAIPHRKFSVFSFLGLILFLYKNRIKIVHSHGRGAGIYSRLVGLFGFKVVHTFHGIHFTSNLQGMIACMIEKCLLPLADTYIFCSEDERDAAFKRGIIPKRYELIFNAVNLEKFSWKDSREELKVIGTMARFDPVKGFPELFKNIEYINSLNCKFQFLIAGASHEDLKDFRIPDNVKILGEISNIQEFYQSIDLYLSHSLREGMPLTVLEAMATGIPCLLSEVPGHHYFIKNKMALGFELGHSKDFKDKLENLVSQNSRQELSFNAFVQLKLNHSLENLILKNLDVYKKLQA